MTEGLEAVRGNAEQPTDYLGCRFEDVIEPDREVGVSRLVMEHLVLITKLAENRGPVGTERGCRRVECLQHQAKEYRNQVFVRNNTTKDRSSSGAVRCTVGLVSKRLTTNRR